MRQIFVLYYCSLFAFFQLYDGAPSFPLSDQLLSINANEERPESVVPPTSLGNISELRYFLWTRSNPGDDEYFILNPFELEGVTASTFDGDLPTYVLHPGWTDSGYRDWILDGKTELLKMKECNVISVDWGLVVPGPSRYYYDEVEIMYQVAHINAQLLDWLITERGLSVDRIEMTGHSLGAHSAGMTAAYMTSAGKISRITGLDPAGPLFYNKTAETRLDKSQANFVDIIHSNGGPAYDACYGIGQSLGHVDFFPNGGVHMPLCVRNTNSSGGPHLLDASGCSHQKSPAYWTESLAFAADPIGNLTFFSWPCNNWDTFQRGECTSCGQGCLNMGFNVDRSLEGNYYLRTRGRNPYAMGDDQGN